MSAAPSRARIDVWGNPRPLEGIAVRAAVDQDACVGCGLCTEICPEVFELGADDLAQAESKAIARDLVRACRRAAESCPLDAIALTPIA